MRSLDELAHTLCQLDGQSYPRYRQIHGRWGTPECTLVVDHVQGDPFATPSSLRLQLSASVHQIPRPWRDLPIRRVALADLLLRHFADATRVLAPTGSGRSGQVLVDDGGAEVLPRSGCEWVGETVELRFRVGLPARGRRILGRQAAQLLTEDLLRAATKVQWAQLDVRSVQQWVQLIEDHAFIQSQLHDRGLVAFVRDGSILPRASGIHSAPLPGAIPFQSPQSLRVTLPTMHHGEVRGMGLPVGVTLITGGGFHGKTTLLDAICRGIDPHIPGDGREWVATSIHAVKLRSENGRSVTGVDLRPFIEDLPGMPSTACFSTPDASGSTSLAAAMIEAIEVGATAFLLDEDSCATNLLIRDVRMQALVARETITPLIDRVRQLFDDAKVSTVLVAGGSGDYLEVADTVVLMEDYRPFEVNERAKAIAQTHPTGRATIARTTTMTPPPRRATLTAFSSHRDRRTKVRARGLRELQIADQTVDLIAIEQLVDNSQVRTIGILLDWLHRYGPPTATVAQMIELTRAECERNGLYHIAPLAELASVRPYELAAALNRLRDLHIDTPSPPG